MSPQSHEIGLPRVVPKEATKRKPLSRGEFLKVAYASGLAILGVTTAVEAASRVLDYFEGQTSQNFQDGQPLPISQEVPPEEIVLPESLKQPLEGWLANKDSGSKYSEAFHETLVPLEAYAKELNETSESRGWLVVGNNPGLEIWVGKSKSPELLQESHAVLFKADDELRGFLWNDEGAYSLHGENVHKAGEDRFEGHLAHFSGQVEGNYIGDYGMPNQTPIDPYAPFKFAMEWRGPNKWQGWINFRGEYHERPFGGGKDWDSFPDNNKLKDS